ncbi:hypothetical protein [Clostridioides difficile]|uniref:hypothetical protein n=1 Tax=Clostridioides difficile TaxID=1496 RepID=UPI00098012EC|nr:hypothetical protein [Clostridioides difficile]EKJ1397020.1 hypothetical protein [Clostridioides difficile]SJO36244.1 Uncharacterised protein [Clostridioides difficile]HBF4252411.1 hypothetical protein [Clostridioides difficile]HBF5147970.1 hypothetical protein [Clostridioides difficile]HBH3576583.1 hypothetical protein [Clostridioides difficile]
MLQCDIFLDVSISYMIVNGVMVVDLRFRYKVVVIIGAGQGLGAGFALNFGVEWQM